MCHNMVGLLQHFMPYLHQMGQPYVYYEQVNLFPASYGISRLASRILTFLGSLYTNNMVPDQKESSPFRVHSVCVHDKIYSGVYLNVSSRRK